jgi:hypothetical protein
MEGEGVGGRFFAVSPKGELIQKSDALTTSNHARLARTEAMVEAFRKWIEESGPDPRATYSTSRWTRGKARVWNMFKTPGQLRDRLFGWKRDNLAGLSPEVREKVINAKMSEYMKGIDPARDTRFDGLVQVQDDMVGMGQDLCRDDAVINTHLFEGGIDQEKAATLLQHIASSSVEVVIENAGRSAGSGVISLLLNKAFDKIADASAEALFAATHDPDRGTVFMFAPEHEDLTPEEFLKDEETITGVGTTSI